MTQVCKCKNCEINEKRSSLLGEFIEISGPQEIRESLCRTRWIVGTVVGDRVHQSRIGSDLLPVIPIRNHLVDADRRPIADLWSIALQEGNESRNFAEYCDKGRSLWKNTLQAGQKILQDGNIYSSQFSKIMYNIQ